MPNYFSVFHSAILRPLFLFSGIKINTLPVKYTTISPAGFSTQQSHQQATLHNKFTGRLPELWTQQALSLSSFTC